MAGLLPPRARVAAGEHQPSLAWQQVPAFMAELRKQSGVGARALELAILTAARTGEVRGARWSEFDLEAAVWVVPAERMKARKLHRVPLSDPALAVLRSMLPIRASPDGRVFTGRKPDVALSDITLSAIMRRMNAGDEPRWRDVSGRAAVPHGFRTSFRVWGGEETDYPREVIEVALAHTLKDRVETAHARTDLMAGRRPLMEAWGKIAG